MWPRALLAILALSPVEAWANSIWPFVAYYVEQEFVDNAWTIGIGLAIEFFVVWKVFAARPLKALAADVAMNLASTLAGLAIIYGVAWAGLNWFAELGYRFREPAQFAAIVIVNFAFVCLINALIEGAVLKWAFRLPLDARSFTYLLIANVISAAVSLAGIWMHTSGELWVNPRSLV